MANPLGSTPGIIVGVGVGTAAAAAIEPAIEVPRQDAWSNNPNRVLDPALMARLVAEGGIDLGTAQDDAKREGYGADKMNALVYLAQTVPGFAEALELYRRDPSGFADLWTHSLVKRGLDARYMPHLNELQWDRLDPAAVANAVQQGFVPDAGLLPPAVSGPPFDIPVEMVPLDTLKEFSDQGITEPRAKVMAELSGNPPSPEQLAEMVMRGEIPESGFYTGIREGRTKTKWASALLYYLTHPRLTPGLVINLLLRGWIEKPEADRRLGAYGYTPEQVQDWFDSAGRPMAPVQAFTAFFRGAPSPTGNGAFTKADFVNAIRRSDIRPEYTEPLWGIRHAYPSLFQLRGAVQSGAISQARALTILKYERYEDQDAQALVSSWGGGGAQGKAATKAELAAEYEGGYLTAADYRTALTALGYTGAALDLEFHLSDARRLAKWREKVVDAVGKAYIAHELDDAEALTTLAEVNVTAEAASRLLTLWQIDRGVTVHRLTAAQVKRAYRKAIIDQAAAMAQLANLGYSTADATVFLAE